MKDPPRLAPFSSSVTRAPSCATLKAAVRPASPPPAMTTRISGRLRQGERRLVLHVFYANILRSADEGREGVGPIDEVSDLQTPLLGLPAVVFGRIYQATDVEEHASTVLLRRGFGGTSQVIASLHGRGVVSWGETHLDEGACRFLGRTGAQGEAFEVVVRELSFARDKGEREPFRTCEIVFSVAGFCADFAGEPRRRGFRVGHAYGYAFDLSRRGRRALRGVEEGELAEPAARSHEGVTFRVVHDVEPEMRGQEPGGSVPVVHVEGYVIQLLYLHVFSLLKTVLRREDSTYGYTGISVPAVHPGRGEPRVLSPEGLDYGRWSQIRRSRIGTHGNPRGGADALRQIRRRIVPPWRPRARWGGDQGRNRPLRHRRSRFAALHLRHRGAGRGRADPIPPGQLPGGTPFLADYRDPEPGVRLGLEERDAR